MTDGTAYFRALQVTHEGFALDFTHKCRSHCEYTAQSAEIPESCTAAATWCADVDASAAGGEVPCLVAGGADAACVFTAANGGQPAGCAASQEAACNNAVRILAPVDSRLRFPWPLQIPGVCIFLRAWPIKLTRTRKRVVYCVRRPLVQLPVPWLEAVAPEAAPTRHTLRPWRRSAR